MEDRPVVLIVSVCPNVSAIFLRDVAVDTNALIWPPPKHGFEKLRRVSGTAHGPCPFQANFFESVLAQGKLDTLEAKNCNSWHRDVDDMGPVETLGAPLVLP